MILDRKGASMTRRITIEIDAEDAGGLVKDILDMVVARIDTDVEFNVKQEFIPERNSGQEQEIQVPSFLGKGAGANG